MCSEFSNDDDKRKIHEQMMTIAMYQDFLEWLFDVEIDYMSHSEAEKKFIKWQKQQDKKLNHITQLNK